MPRLEVGDAAPAIIGYFNMKTNRMTMYDLSGSAGPSQPRKRSSNTLAQINQILAQPEAGWNVATIVHEVTHQIAFNCDLHTRFSDCPRWFSEGVAMFFETPDLTSTKGWSSIGKLNRPRLTQFKSYLAQRPAGSLISLLATDKRLLEPSTSANAYAEAWALTYFLIHKYPRQYLDYARTLSAKKPMRWDDAETRLKDFRQAFGEDLEALDQELVRAVTSAR